jgi:uncharacterized protein (TIRG00374 family)
MLRLLKIVVSTSLIGLLVWKADLGTFAADLERIDRVIFGIALLLLIIQYPISAWKWQISLRLHSVEYGYSFLLRMLCIAFFFNNFLPTAIGGDAYRAFRTMDRAGRKAHPISAVILERLLGIVALLLLGYVAGIYLVVNGNLLHREWIMLALAATTACMFAVAFAWMMGLFGKITEWMKNVSKLEPLYDSLRVIGDNKRHLVPLIAMSFVFQCLAVLAVSALFASIGLFGKLFESAFIAVAAGVAGVLPLSINGIGVVEGSFVVAAWEAGLPYSDAIIVALFLRVFMLASSVVFGLLYAIQPHGDPTIPKESTS